MVSDIKALLNSKGLLDKNLIFFDAFCGTGSVSNGLKDYFEIIINDNLKWSVIYSYGRLCANDCTFSTLGFDPFEYLNNSEETRNGFFYSNYSPAESNRKYFTEFNASRIDYFRCQIEEWYTNKLINKEEYSYLIASLIESVSDVSNTAGVYGAFLKHWDSRAKKKIYFDKVDVSTGNCSSIKTYNDKIEDIISEVDCDILYLDPPYTQNQYGTQYHLLETLVLYDSPQISKVTGSRYTAPMRSDWSKEYKVNILFDKILANTKAKYIVLSYNNDGLMSKDFIEASLKRYGKVETYKCEKITYKKYQNWKSNNNNNHFEYLFFIEKKPINEVTYESPLNYIGNKSKMINEIKNSFPTKVDTFIDAFGGGFNVGININANKVIYNDINFIVKNLIFSFKKYDTYDYLTYVKRTIKKFDLQKSNSDSYLKIRDYYNSLPKNKRDPRLLFTIIMYGYQQQIRFNSDYNFNNPVGMRWFNDKVLEKFVSFSRKIKEQNNDFFSNSYYELNDFYDQNCFYYFDPPYKLTTGSYNDGRRGFNGWNDSLEQELFDYIDNLNKRNIPFMLSYVYEHKGKTNESLKKWYMSNNYHVKTIENVLGISGSRRKEVLITNYEC